MVKVSIVVPIYNVIRYIDEALKSVLNQTLLDLEIILIDDGSSDGSGSYIDNLARTDNRVKVYHQKNKGYGQAVNAGLSLATGEYVAIFEPDDRLDLTMYEKLFNTARRWNAEIVRCGFSVFNSKTSRDVVWAETKELLINGPDGVFAQKILLKYLMFIQLFGLTFIVVIL